MRRIRLTSFLVGACLLAVPVTAAAATRTVKVAGPWLAVHLLNYQSDADLETLEQQLPALAARGVNVLVIPKDVIICDWHYGKRDSYPSVQMFLDKGFRVLPASFKDVEASQALIGQTMDLNAPRVLGHLFTTWSKQPKVADWPPLAANAGLVRKAPASRR